MQSARRHLTTAELEEQLPEVLESPQQAGQLEAIFVRPAKNERSALTTATVTPEGGIAGDRWSHESPRGKPNDPPDRANQISLMNIRFLRQIAGQAEAFCLAGDNLLVDLDLSEENLPAGSRLTIGHDVVIEISPEPHTGCGKFQVRYGADARKFMNNERGSRLHLRGRYGFVVTGGTIAVGDTVRKLADD